MKDCLYHAKKGDEVIVEGNKVMFLRKQTLRDVYVGEFFYADKDGEKKFVAIEDGSKAGKYVLIAGINPEIGKIEQMRMQKMGKVWRVRGVCVFSDADIAEVCDLEIRKDKTDATDEVFPKTVYDVYEQFKGDSEFLETFETREDAEKYCRKYRVQKWLESKCRVSKFFKRG